MIQFHTILFFTSFIYTSSVCTCPPMRLSDHQEYEVENSEYIFIGEVLEIDKSTDTYKVKVIENLKNCDNEGVIYIGENWTTCSPYIDSKGMWLIYAKLDKDYLRVNLCGISRSLDNPQKVFSSVNPPITQKNETKEEYMIRRDEWKIANKKKSKEDLNNEIKALKERFK